MILTVNEAFLGHAKGDIIRDAEMIKQYIGSEWEGHFIKTAAPDFVGSPAPATE